eukprot:4327240-Prorocentrum_lima.AAC.1
MKSELGGYVTVATCSQERGSGHGDGLNSRTKRVGGTGMERDAHACIHGRSSGRHCERSSMSTSSDAGCQSNEMSSDMMWPP